MKGGQGSVFSLSLDGTHRWMTLLVGVVLLGLVMLEGGAAVRSFLAGHTGSGLLFGAAALLVLGLMLGIYVFSPRSYRVEESWVTVDRIGPKVRIHAAHILDVKPVTLGLAIRTCGCAGFFGAWGWFWTRGIGSYRAYLTRKDNLVLLELKNRRPVVLSPDDPDRFAMAVREIALGS